jgi:hypothetical protein
MPENKLTFNEKEHLYSLDNINIPSFSKIVRDLGLVDLSMVNQDDLRYKQQIGTAVHKAIFLHNAGRLNMDSLDENVTPYFSSWLKFIELYHPKILTQYSEKPICSVKWRYGVTPDIVAELKPGVTIIELKTTTSMSPVISLQTEAQAIAILETYKIKIKQRWGLQLIPNSLPKLEVYNDMSDFTVWISIMNFYNWKGKNNLLKGK